MEVEKNFKTAFAGGFGVVDSILEKYEYKKANLIAILQAIQGEYNYLPEEVLIYLGTKMPLSPATILIKFFLIFPDIVHKIAGTSMLSRLTLNIELPNSSCTTPEKLKFSCFAI